jgi:hypothetical protein
MLEAQGGAVRGEHRAEGGQGGAQLEQPRVAVRGCADPAARNGPYRSWISG